MELAQDRVQWRVLVLAVLKLRVPLSEIYIALHIHGTSTQRTVLLHASGAPSPATLSIRTVKYETSVLALSRKSMKGDAEDKVPTCVKFRYSVC
jgi:hypothetical protein